jgi:hypothetical protein
MPEDNIKRMAIITALIGEIITTTAAEIERIIR